MLINKNITNILQGAALRGQISRAKSDGHVSTSEANGLISRARAGGVQPSELAALRQLASESRNSNRFDAGAKAALNNFLGNSADRSYASGRLPPEASLPQRLNVFGSAIGQHLDKARLNALDKHFKKDDGRIGKGEMHTVLRNIFRDGNVSPTERKYLQQKLWDPAVSPEAKKEVRQILSMLPGARITGDGLHVKCPKSPRPEFQLPFPLPIPLPIPGIGGVGGGLGGALGGIGGALGGLGGIGGALGGIGGALGGLGGIGGALGGIGGALGGLGGIGGGLGGALGGLGGLGGVLGGLGGSGDPIGGIGNAVAGAVGGASSSSSASSASSGQGVPSGGFPKYPTPPTDPKDLNAQNKFQEDMFAFQQASQNMNMFWNMMTTLSKGMKDTADGIIRNFK